MSSLLRSAPLLLIVVGCAANADTKPSVGLTGSYGSAYLFRGAPQNDKGVFQGEVTTAIETGTGSAFVTLWGNVDSSNDTGDAVFPDGNGGKFTEIDTIVGYSWSGAGMSYETGLIGYQFPNGVGASTNELYAAVSLDDVALAPTFTVYYDFDEVEGFYATVGGSHAFEVGENLSLGLGLSVGYSSDDHSGAYYGLGEAGLADLLASVTLAWEPEDMPSFELGINSSSMIDSDLSDSLETNGISADTVFVLLSISQSY